MPIRPPAPPCRPLRRLSAGAALLLGLAAAAEGGEADPLFGYWLTGNGRAIVEIGRCDGADTACGRIVWTAGAGRRCGVMLIEGLARDDDGGWSGGHIRDPRDGTRYRATARVEGDRLNLRGYVGLPLFGRTQVWTRVEDDRGGCAQPESGQASQAPAERASSSGAKPISRINRAPAASRA